MRLRASEAMEPSRRVVIAGAGAAIVLGSTPGAASTADMMAAMRDIVGPVLPRPGRVALDIPALVENGNSVTLEINVESLMTPADHVTEIIVFAPENPLPVVSRFTMGPRCGKAVVKTSVRLATSQTVHVVAVMRDGSSWLGTAEVEVTTAACFDPT